MPTTDDVRAWLIEIPQLAWWLPRAAIARPDSSSGGGGGKPGSKPPIRAAALDLLDMRLKLDKVTNPAWCDPEQVGVLPYLYGWCRDIAFELTDADRPGRLPTRPTIPKLCRWIQYHLEFAAGLPQWEEFAWGIGYVRAAVEASTRDVRDDAPKHLVVHGEDCGQGFLHPLSDREWRCDACDKHIRIRAVTLPEAARIADWGLRTLQRWAKEGRFTRVEYRKVAYYDLGQLLAAIAEAKLADTLSA